MGNARSCGGIINAILPTWYARRKYHGSTVASSDQRAASSDSADPHSNHHSKADGMNRNCIEVLFEIDVLDLKLHRSLPEGLVSDIHTDAVWVTIPRALNGRPSKALLVDRHQRILTKREHSALYRDLKNHVLLAVSFCQAVQSDHAYAERLAHVPKIQELQHPHIVRLYGHFMHNRMLHILTEYCQHGNLAAVLEYDARFEHTMKRRLPMFSGVDALLESARQLCSGVAFIHSSKLVHTNLSTGNVFVNDEGNLLIGDFKDAVRIDNGDARRVISIPVHHGFAAPERYMTDDGETKVKVDLVKADAWSTGMLIFVMATRQWLFSDASTARTEFDSFKRIGFSAYYASWKANTHVRADHLVDIPNDIHEALIDLLHPDPATRLSVAEAITKFEWLQGGDFPRHLEACDWKMTG